MILSAQSIVARGVIQPCAVEPWKDRNGNSCGLSACSYDITVSEKFVLLPGQFRLSASREYINLPNDIMATIRDKSSLVRRGLHVFNTLADPGWRGYLTLELHNVGHETFYFEPGDAIAQVVFEWLDKPTMLPYSGKYQDQAAGPQPAR